jgi:WD40 repeat protein
MCIKRYPRNRVVCRAIAMLGLPPGDVLRESNFWPTAAMTWNRAISLFLGRVGMSLFALLVLNGIRDESLLAQSPQPVIANQTGKPLLHAGDTVIVTSSVELKDGETTLMVLQPNTRLIVEAVSDDRYWLQVSVSRGTEKITGWIPATNVHKGAADISGSVGEGIQNDDASLTVALSLLSQADNHWSQREYAREEPLLRQALEIRKKALGENHPDYAEIVNRLGVVYYMQREYARAEPLYRQALEIRKTAFGKDHPDYAQSLNNLASVYHMEREYARAEPLYRQALEIRKTALGENHPDYAANLEGLANLYQDRGEKARAEPLQRQAAEIRKKAREKPILVLNAGGHTARVTQILFTPDGKELISVSDDKTIRTWDVATGEPRRVLRPPIAAGVWGMIEAAALSPDGSLLAVGGLEYVGAGSIYLVSLDRGNIDRVLSGHALAIQALAFSPDGKRLASGSTDHTIRIWDTASGKCEKTLKGHTDVVRSLAFSPDGRHLASASLDKTCRIWLLEQGASDAILSGHTAWVRCIAWSPDGRTIASGGDDQVRLWEPDGTPGKFFEKLGNGIQSVTFSPDSRELLFTRGGFTSFYACSLLDLANGRERLRFTRHNNTVGRSDISPDGSLVATSGGNEQDIFVWRRSDGSVLHRLAGKGRSNYSAAWSPDGSAIAWGSTNWGNSFKATCPLELSFDLSELAIGEAARSGFRRGLTAQEGTQLVWKDRRTVAVKRDAQTDSELRVPGQGNMVRCAALLPGDRAAVGSSGGLFMFDIRSGYCIRQVAGHAGEVFAVAPSPDGRYLLSASQDQTLQVWDLRSYRWEPLLSLFVAGDDWIAWTPEGYYAASPGGEDLMGWQVNHGPDKMATFYPAAEFRKSLYRPDVICRMMEFGNVDKALAAADKARGKETLQASIEEVLPPLVAITSPDQPKVETEGPTIDVQFTAKPVGAHPITAVRLLVNGRPYPGVEGIKRFDPPRADEVRDSWLVRLASGENRIAVQAESAVSNAISEPVVVTLPVRGVVRDDASPEERKALLPSLYILAVGISEYPEKLRLNYAAEDAKALAETCQKYSQDMYRKLDVKLLTDKQATRRDVLRGLTWLRQQMTQNDVGILFFAGHGTQDADGKLYLLPVDVELDDLLSTGVPMEQVKSTLAGIPGRFVLMLDACHTGSFDGTKRRTSGSLTDDLVRDLATDDFGVIGMCSCMAREYALESPALHHGYFTEAVVEGLSGKALRSVGGAVYIHHLNAYVTDRVKELSHGRQHPVTAMPSTVRSFPITKP